ncbi:acyltransferase family protein [Sphingomonas sp. TZW2008]|uniref:acyltransferase family protein n=1 Tax=Sphingomonas sp. TZW2008 TaxID=1917973 RepID=UPI0015C4F02D|nr:acyltransferase family protein [Sphingomonas sp. TZW2008]
MSDTVPAPNRAVPGPARASPASQLANHADATAERGFRNDINALRALAASVVVLFHFHVAGFRGGFVGVDVFFVISGLLMTQIVERGVSRGSFSILGFYAARVRRIVPALATLCVFLVLVGLVALDPLTLAETARNAAASVLFVSNILYARQSGYFADASEANWLLHTWTLSAEWQFYMLYPIVLALVARWEWLWRRRLAFVAIGCAVGLLATLWIASRSTHLRDYAFFLLPTRAWEMLAGGVLALWAPRPSRAGSAALAIGGFVLILLSVFWLDDAVPWPSIWTLMPVLGAVAVLAADQRQARWATLPGMRSLGVWSYSLYLWHWPIVVAFVYAGCALIAPVIAIGVALSVVAAVLSYTLIETRLRDAVFGTARTTPRRRWGVIAASAALVAAGLIATLQTTGFEAWRTRGFSPAARAQLADFRAASNDWVGFAPCERRWRIGAAQGCQLGTGNPVRVAVVGDSHAEQMIPRLKRLADGGRVEVTLLRNSGCAPLSRLTWTRGEGECAAFADRVFPLVAEGRYARVLVVSAWALYFGDAGGRWTPGALCSRGWRGCRAEHDEAVNAANVDVAFAQLATRLAKIRAGGAEVAILLPEPFNFDQLPRHYYRRVFATARPVAPPAIDRTAFYARTAWVRAKLASVASAAGVRTIDPLPFLCDAVRCPLTSDGHFLYKDKHHIRASLAADAPRFGYLDAFVLGTL